jgi:hypothetical protein
MGTGLTAVDGCGRWLGLEVEETIGGEVDESQEQMFRDLFVLCLVTCSTFSGV